MDGVPFSLGVYECRRRETMFCEDTHCRVYFFRKIPFGPGDGASRTTREMDQGIDVIVTVTGNLMPLFPKYIEFPPMFPRKRLGLTYTERHSRAISSQQFTYSVPLVHCAIIEAHAKPRLSTSRSIFSAGNWVKP